MFDKLLFSGIKQALSNVKRVTDTAVDIAINAGVKYAAEKLETFNRQWRVNFVRTCCFDAAFIAAAVACVIRRTPWAAPLLWGIGAAKLGWTLGRALALYINLKPHKELIKHFAPATLRELWQTRSLRQTLVNTIRNVFRYYYGAKLNAAVKTIHDIAALLGAAPSAEAVENKVVEKVYPPLNRFIRRVLFINALCFFVFYGIFIRLAKMYLMRLAGV